MLKIAIYGKGGIGPESTLLYYKKITEKVYKREKLFPPLLIESLDVYRVLSYCGQKDCAGLTEYLATRGLPIWRQAVHK